MSTSGNILIALLLAGLLGALGQGVRALAGLKKLTDAAAMTPPGQESVFIAARLAVSLMVGCLAGIAAGLTMGLGKLVSIDSNSIDVLLGIAAAGYAGTDFIESFTPLITAKSVAAAGQPAAPVPLAPFTIAAAAPGGLLPLPAAVTFGSLVPGGFFSADPNDQHVRRSIRSNNPGALNFTRWQAARLGFAGTTQPDSSPNHNITTIYRTPEHGIAAWYHLIAHLYNFPGGLFTLNDLAASYAGSHNAAAIGAYVSGWSRWLRPAIPPTQQISTGDTQAMLTLGRAMFSHEAGIATPVHDDQITYAIEHERNNTLPA